MKKTQFNIGFFDSGIGGISVLKEAIKLLPNENYVYFGDSKNAPYGVKTAKEVEALSFRAVDFLIDNKSKAIVVACNTATSAAIENLRKCYRDIPIIGIEPALKPAVENYGNGTIVIMATPMTLAEKKFSRLREKYSERFNIVPMPCDGLVEIIEAGHLGGVLVEEYLQDKFKDLDKKSISSVVLGCTHYPFIKESLQNVLGDNVTIIDGSLGTAKQLQRILKYNNLLNNNNEQGNIKIYNSKEDDKIIEFCYELLQR